MNRRDVLNRMLVGALGGASIGVSGCGTIFHQERIHQPHSRDIDWRIAALDGLGLALFFVPGVVAFAVDFYTGAIYLPPRGYAATDPPGDTGSPVALASHEGLRRHEVDPSDLNPETIERVVAEEVGKPVSLNESSVRVSELSDLQQFDSQVERHKKSDEFGMNIKQFFAKVINRP